MSKLKSFLLGTLAATGLSASAQKEFKDPGIRVNLDGQIQMDAEKFSETVKKQKMAFDKETKNYAGKLFRPDMIDSARVPAAQAGIDLARDKAVAYLLNLPMQKKEYEELKSKLISLVAMTQSMEVRRMAKPANMVDPTKIEAFMRMALRIDFAINVITREMSYMPSPNILMFPNERKKR
jgi:hypothetical protein